MLSNFISNIRQNKYSLNLRNFTIVQLTFILGYILMTAIVYVTVDNPYYTYLTLFMAFLCTVGLINVSRTGNQKLCAIVTSVVMNLVYFPFCFIGFNKLITVVPMYFILGLLYTGLLIEGRTGFILCIIETLYMGIFISIFGRDMIITVPGQESFVEMFAISVALVVVSVLSSFAVKYRVVQSTKEFEKAENVHLKVIDAYNQKDIFLANTSHEIRTPLNAIVGTVNLLLEDELSTNVKDNVYHILNSCNTLLSITDELIDLSNTDNKAMEISPRRYDFNEMLTDIINMISVRLMETEIDFYVEIDKDIPRYLVGDNTKIRQLFINILNNAVKYTKTGSITLRVKGDFVDKGHIKIFTEVEDTGIGIKEEKISSLFEYYNRDDDQEKRDIEGTGIGLNLCKEILDKLGGTIAVKSEYHVGSTFFFSYTQQVDSFERMVNIANGGAYNVLIFERNEELSRKLQEIFSYIGVKSQCAIDRDDFESKVISEKFDTLFVAVEKYTENKRFLERKLKNEKLVIISDIENSTNYSRVGALLTRPVYIINVAKALKNKNNSHVMEMINRKGFILPNTKILVVDDNLTNLEVAKGIMNRYEADIQTAISGAECLKLLESFEPDIIFLDYMMPEMNGIDTLYNIRALDNPKYKDIPIVALTANVVNGAREMFLEAGFNDYIAKPIDINKLEKILKKLLPENQLTIKTE